MPSSTCDAFRNIFFSDNQILLNLFFIQNFDKILMKFMKHEIVFYAIMKLLNIQASANKF